MKIRMLFIILLVSVISLKGMEQPEEVVDTATLETEEFHLLNLPLEVLTQIVVKQLESCTPKVVEDKVKFTLFEEQLKEIDRLRAVNTQFNTLFADADGPFMKIILRTLKIDNLTQEEKNTHLLEAAERGRVWLVTTLLELGANVDARDEEGKTALYWALKKEQLHVAGLIIESAILSARMTNMELMQVADIPADLKTEFLNFFTEMLAQIVVKQPESEEQLQKIDHLGAKLDGLFVANKQFNEFDTDFASHFIKLVLKTLNPDNLKQEDKNKCLARAAQNGRLFLVKFLIELGANINAKTKEKYDGLPSLHMAAFNGHTEVVKLLLEKGADVNARDEEGKTALHWAAENRRKKVVKMLITNGADVNAKDNHDRTAFNEALIFNCKYIVKMLIKHGFDVNAKNKYGDTIWSYKAAHGCESMVKMLIQCGVDVDAKNGDGSTALHYAAKRGHLGIVKLLIANTVKIHAKNNRDNTALHEAAKNGHKDIVEVLLKHDAKIIDAKNEDDRTPLHMAAFNGHTEVVKLLITNGVDINEKDNKGQTPLYMAAKNGYLKIAKALLKHGAFDQKNNNGSTALYCAIIKGHIKIAGLISASIFGASLSHSALANFFTPKAETTD